jgi:hypothetical protein
MGDLDLLTVGRISIDPVLDLDYRTAFWRTRDETSATIGAAIDHATIVVCGLGAGEREVLDLPEAMPA